MIQSHGLNPPGRQEFKENAPPATNIQHWTAASKVLYKALLNPADQIFAAAEFVKTDRLHSGNVIGLINLVRKRVQSLRMKPLARDEPGFAMGTPLLLHAQPSAFRA